MVDKAVERIKSQHKALVSLSTCGALFDSHFEDAVHSLTETAAATLEVQRASVWLFEEDNRILRCVDLYERSTAVHVVEPDLRSDKYPGYFAALREERMLAAHDVSKDERVAELGPGYLDRLHITSMLDSPIRWRGKMVGVLCNEHVGTPREWLTDEQYFSGCLADFATILLDARESAALRTALQFERELQARIYALSSYFINLSLDEIEKGIKAVLGSFGELADAERITLLEFEDERTRLRSSFQWSGKRAKYTTHPLEGEIVAKHPWLSSKIFRNSPLEFPDVEQLPPEADALRAALERDGIRSGLYIPLSSREGLHAVLAIDTIRNGTVWHSRCINALRLGGETVLNALLYRRDRAKLAEAGKFYRTVLESMIEAVIITNLDGRIIFSSDGSRIFRRSDEELAAVVTLEELLGESLVSLPELRANGPFESLHYEWTNHGHKKVLSVSVKLVTLEGKERILYICRDITRQKELETQLLQAQRMEIVGQISSALVHDFNNLLTPIIGYSKLLEKEFSEGSKQRHYAALIQNGASLGQAIVRRLLSFGAKTDGEEQLFELDEVIEDATELLDFSIPSNIRIESEIRARPAPLRGDQIAIYQIFMNLCINAAQSIGSKEGIIRITLDRRESARPGERSYYVLSVSDTGSGIPPEARERIFEPFFTTKKAGVGTGLGLPMAKACIEKMGGSIEFETEMDRGTTFRVYVPAADDAK